MLKTVHRISTFLLIALGVVHTSLTPVLVGRLSQGAMYFAGAGLAMIFVGFLNVILNGEAGRQATVRALTYAANLLVLAFGALAVLVIREPQAYFGMLLLVVITATAFGLKR